MKTLFFIKGFDSNRNPYQIDQNLAFQKNILCSKNWGEVWSRQYIENVVIVFGKTESYFRVKMLTLGSNVSVRFSGVSAPVYTSK